jgi:hypothetical protein
MLELKRQIGKEGRGGARPRGVEGIGTFEKRCEECGKLFVTSTKRTKFCSDECRYKRDQFARERKFQKNNPKRECAECGKWFQPTIKGQVTCSVECREKRNRKRLTNQQKHMRGESKIAVERARDLLMAEKAAMTMTSGSVYDKMLQMSHDELMVAYDRLSATEKREYLSFYRRTYGIAAGNKIVRSFRKYRNKPSEFGNMVNAMLQGKGYSSKSTKEYMKKHREKYLEYNRRYRQQKKAEKIKKMGESNA